MILCQWWIAWQLILYILVEFMYRLLIWNVHIPAYFIPNVNTIFWYIVVDSWSTITEIVNHSFCWCERSHADVCIFYYNHTTDIINVIHYLKVFYFYYTKINFCINYFSWLRFLYWKIIISCSFLNNDIFSVFLKTNFFYILSFFYS